VPPAKSGTRGGARRLLLQLCARRAKAIVRRACCSIFIIILCQRFGGGGVRLFLTPRFPRRVNGARSRAPQWRASRMCATHYAFLPTRFSDVIRSSLSFLRPRHLSWHTCVDVNARTEQWIVFFSSS